VVPLQLMCYVRMSKPSASWTVLIAAISSKAFPDKAARCVFWHIFHLRNAGQTARAAVWIARLRRLLDDDDPNGHLAYLGVLGEGVALMQAGSVIQALPMVEHAAAGARAAGDDDLFVLAGLARGRCLDAQGHRTQALEALDEIMVDVVADRVAPQVVGIAYCSVISLCMGRLDMQRAAEWTQALSRWCDAQSGLLPYRGECQVHRAEILQLHGSWAEATQTWSRLASDCRQRALLQGRLTTG
jgi:hypothetical protein